MNYNLKDNVKGLSTLLYYRDNALWYMTETGLIFPIRELDGATFAAVEKSMLLMRWIRKYINECLQDDG